MTVEKPKPKKLQSQSPVQTNNCTIFSQPWTHGIYGVIYQISKPNWEQKCKIIYGSYFENDMVWHKPKPTLQ